MKLIIPDTHTYWGDNTDRFVCLGHFALKHKPEHIVIMGDWWDFESINYFDAVGSKTKEGKRLLKDLDGGGLALTILFEPIVEYNKKQRAAKKKIYIPNITFLEGNHEFRLKRYLESNPVLEGLIDLPSFLTARIHRFFPGCNFNYVPYGEAILIDDVIYSHILFKGGRPITSVVNTCGAVIQVVDKSVVFAHTHRLEWKQFKRLGSNKLYTALNVGGFMENLPNYMKASNPHWWSGVVLLAQNTKGEMDITTVSLQSLKEWYNGQ